MFNSKLKKASLEFLRFEDPFYKMRKSQNMFKGKNN